MNPRMKISLAIAAVTLVAADWLSKVWVIREMSIGEMFAVLDGWLYFVHRKNPGVAFSMFADLPDAWRTPLLAGVSAVGVVLFWRILVTSDDRWVEWAAAVVMAGAIGNLGDRLLNGHVTDFVLVSFFPFVFNVADAAITVGGVLLAARLLFADSSAEEPARVTG
ncbi:MAG TPA: signal peptidase II [Longimicrobiaceae bacterium]|nr:signal peptidase II [Longimicrobiaceae bacterium]